MPMQCSNGEFADAKSTEARDDLTVEAVAVLLHGCVGQVEAGEPLLGQGADSGLCRQFAGGVSPAPVPEGKLQRCLG